ncbi:MAG TPA: hypothetical protein VIL89_09920, partial [Clostridia bacterium]
VYAGYGMQAEDENFLNKSTESYDDSLQPEDNNKKPVSSSNIISGEEASVNSEITDNSNEEIIKINRREAGLTTIPSLDFSQFEINPSILRLIEKPAAYTNEDYKTGLIRGSYIIVSERFEENIIQDITIGDDIPKVTGILGEPSSITGDTIFYKTKDYYLGFKGREKVEQAIISNKPRKYFENILETIIDSINSPEFSGISSLLSKNGEISGFFDYNGHIHGGGWYACAMNGIFLEEFTENSITIYNNFEGNLYKLKGDTYKYGIKYTDIDYMINSMATELNGYIETNEMFRQRGILSPNGKYNSIYVWNYSESYYFIIRTMDNSCPDKYIELPATGDYYWLDDTYILYSDFFSSTPVLLNVESNETIDVHSETELRDP